MFDFENAVNYVYKNFFSSNASTIGDIINDAANIFSVDYKDYCECYTALCEVFHVVN